MKNDTCKWSSFDTAELQLFGSMSAKDQETLPIFLSSSLHPDWHVVFSGPKADAKISLPESTKKHESVNFEFQISAQETKLVLYLSARPQDTMTQLVTIKCQLDDDLRRFSLAPTCTYEDLCKQLTSLYHIDESFLLKYSDDEGDLISVTTTEELVEAFRLSKDLRPPILRLHMYRTNKSSERKPTKEVKESNEYPPLPISEWDAPKKQLKTPEEVVMPTLKKDETPQSSTQTTEQIEEESNEYPPLPISEWDAPAKKPVLLVNVKVPQSLNAEDKIIPITISAQIQQQCTATSADVAKYSQETLQVALPFAGSYSHLSSNIAAQCKELANTTAEMSKRLASLQAEETLRTGTVSKEVSDLSRATLRDCQKLSEATAALCQSLSASTLEDCKSFSAGSNARLVDTTSHLANLSEDIKGKCDQLSAETSARSVQTCTDIRKMIMNM